MLLCLYCPFALFFWYFPDMFLEGSHTLIMFPVTEKASAITVFLHTMLSIPLVILVALFFTFSVEGVLGVFLFVFEHA